MRNPVLARTSGGVETVSVLDKVALDNVARWLCQEDSYHDKYDAFNSNGHIGCQDADFETFKHEQQHNGGYCNICLNYAGELLSVFNLQAESENI